MTEAELLNQIRQMAANGSGFTTRQIAAKCGITQSRAYTILVALLDAGKIRPAVVQIVDRHGKTTTVPGYCFPEVRADAGTTTT